MGGEMDDGHKGGCSQGFVGERRPGGVCAGAGDDQPRPSAKRENGLPGIQFTARARKLVPSPSTSSEAGVCCTTTDFPGCSQFTTPKATSTLSEPNSRAIRKAVRAVRPSLSRLPAEAIPRGSLFHGAMVRRFFRFRDPDSLGRTALTQVLPSQLPNQQPQHRQKQNADKAVSFPDRQMAPHIGSRQVTDPHRDGIFPQHIPMPGKIKDRGKISSEIHKLGVGAGM